MQVHNMLERKGYSYKAGNIKLIKIKPEFVEIRKRDGEVLMYKRIKGG